MLGKPQLYKNQNNYEIVLRVIKYFVYVFYLLLLKDCLSILPWVVKYFPVQSKQLVSYIGKQEKMYGLYSIKQLTSNPKWQKQQSGNNMVETKWQKQQNGGLHVTYLCFHPSNCFSAMFFLPFCFCCASAVPDYRNSALIFPPKRPCSISGVSNQQSVRKT